MHDYVGAAASCQAGSSVRVQELRLNGLPINSRPQTVQCNGSLDMGDDARHVQELELGATGLYSYSTNKHRQPALTYLPRLGPCQPIYVPTRRMCAQQTPCVVTAAHTSRATLLVFVVPMGELAAADCARDPASTAAALHSMSARNVWVNSTT